MRTQINGISLHYEDGGHGPAVLLTHGYSATSAMWAYERQVLEPTHRVVTWDVRGHGDTESPDDPAGYSQALAIGDMVGLLDHLGIETAVVGGLSLGGFLSLAFYRDHPERVRALVICDSGPGYRNPDARAEWNAAAERRATELESRGLEALQGRSREVQGAVEHHRSAQGLAHAARGILAQLDSSVIDLLPHIQVPTLILVGADDEPFLAPSRYMAKKIPTARLERIPGAGHAANLDQPQRFNELLLSFLRDLG